MTKRNKEGIEKGNETDNIIDGKIKNLKSERFIISK